jgi:Domain of unknown function (DUF6430)
MPDFKEFLKQGTDRWLVAFGALITLLSLFRVEDIKKLDLQPRPASYLALVIGIAFVVVGIVLHSWEAGAPGITNRGVKRDGDGLKISVGQAEISVVFGQIENASQQHQDSIVVLPANEFFDDDCMQDAKSALGAFVLRYFSGRVHELKESLARALKAYPSEVVEKEAGHSAPSFGVGTCVVLERPLQTQWRLIFAAVTSKRARQGLQANSYDVVRAVREVGCKMADLRADKLILPVLGSGHGGLSREAALTCLLIGFVELLRSTGGRGLRQVIIVVFRSADSKRNDLSMRQVARALSLAHSCCE